MPLNNITTDLVLYALVQVLSTGQPHAATGKPARGNADTFMTFVLSVLTNV